VAWVRCAEDDSPRLVCGVCEHEWCQACKVAWHSGRSCDEHQREAGEAQADEGMREYEANNRLVHCPTCGHGIEKISGCNRVQCVAPASCCWFCVLDDVWCLRLAQAC
jgi:hypothetical protein